MMQRRRRSRGRSAGLAAAVITFGLPAALMAAQTGPARIDIRPEETVVGTGGWSAVVDGLRGRAIVTEGPVFQGTRLLKVYVELRDLSTALGSRKLRYSPDQTVRGRLVNADGTPVPEPGLPVDRLVPMPYDLVLPHDSTLRLCVSYGGIGVPPGTATMLEYWPIRSGDTHTYLWKAEVASRLTVEQKEAAARSGDRYWQGTLDLPAVRLIGLGRPAR